jgi:hypothetical protein
MPFVTPVRIVSDGGFGYHQVMEKTSDKRVVTADEIAEMADAGMDITRFITGFGRMMPPLAPSTPASCQPVEIAGGTVPGE